MSRSDWNLLAPFAGLAALLCAFGIGLYVASLNYPDEQRYQPYRYTPSDPEAARASLADQTKAPEYRNPCHKPEGQDESDLCAQWKAARAAERGALWTERDFWVGLGSVVGLGLTIILTLKATQAAQRSALAAEKAVEGSERPHLLLDWCKVDLREPTLDDRCPMTFSFQNHGKGPCWVREWGILVRTQDLDDPIDAPASVLRGYGSPWAVAPNTKWHSTKPFDVLIGKGEAPKVLAGEKLMLIFWSVRYSDSDQRSHDHNFALQLIDVATEPRLVPLYHPFFLYT